MAERAPRLLIALHRLGSGGVERVALHLANGLAARGNAVTLALVRGDGELIGKVSPQVAVRQLAGGERTGRGLRLAAMGGALAGVIRAERPDVLLSPGNHMHLAALLAHRRAGVADCRLALKFTNPIERDPPRGPPNALRRAFFRFAARRADTLLVLSEAAQRQAAALLPASLAAKLRQVDNPYVEQAMADRRDQDLPPPPGPPLLLSIGRLTAQKDQAMMLDALAGLVHLPWRLMLLGEGPLRSALAEQATRLGIADRVELAGYVDDPAPLLRQARAFLLSSRYEELPAVLFEALAARCPIVATSASPTIVDLFGDRALLSPPGDVTAYRAQLAAELAQPKTAPDPAEYLTRFSIAAGVASHAAALGLL